MCAGYSNFADDIVMMLGRKPNKFMRITWLFFVPCLLMVRLSIIMTDSALTTN